MITVEDGKTYYGLSTDTKPTDVENSAVFYEMNTGKLFMFNAATGQWIEQ